MNKLFLPAAALLIVSAASSCRMNVLEGEGSRGSNAPTVASFNAIDIDVPVETDINVQEGATASVKFDGYDNVLKHIVAKVEGNKLRIYCDLDDTWEVDCDDVKAHITVPSITALSLSGAPDANVHGSIKGGGFKLDISGASTVVIDNMAVDDFSSDISGAAKIEVKGGTARRASYEISGAGKIIAFPLQTDETIASISGAGKAEVWAARKLSAGISGAGTVKYKGHPAVSKEVSGVGSVAEAN